MQQSASANQFGRLAHVDFDVGSAARAPRSSANFLPGHFGLVRLEAGDGEARVGHRLADAPPPSGTTSRLWVTSCVREPGRIATSGPRARCCGQKRLVERLPANLVEERVADEGRVAAALAKPRLLERQAAQHVVDQPPHLLPRQLAQAQICGGA